MPGSTNFLPWNSGQANQKSDGAYAADASRTGGAGINSIFPSATANKVLYQCAGFISAFCLALVNKGYSPTDTSLTTLQGVLANVLTTADVNGNLVAVTYAPSIIFNCGTNNGFQLGLTGNVTASSFSGFAVGQEITMVFVQDIVGGRTFAWPSGITTAGTPDPTPGAVSIQKFKKLIDGSVHPITAMTVS